MASRFCELYRALSDAYFRGAEKLLSACPNGFTEPISISVECSIKEKSLPDGVIAVERKLKVNGWGVSQKTENIDLFCTQNGCFLETRGRKKEKKVEKKASG